MLTFYQNKFLTFGLICFSIFFIRVFVCVCVCAISILFRFLCCYSYQCKRIYTMHPKVVYTLWTFINSISIKIYLSFIIQIKDNKCSHFALLYVVKLITVLDQTQLTTQTNRIAYITNHFIWNFGAFSLSGCFHFIDCCRFYAIKLIFKMLS